MASGLSFNALSHLDQCPSERISKLHLCDTSFQYIHTHVALFYTNFAVAKETSL
jgi:hypothetical protein